MHLQFKSLSSLYLRHIFATLYVSKLGPDIGFTKTKGTILLALGGGFPGGCTLPPYPLNLVHQNCELWKFSGRNF